MQNPLYGCNVKISLISECQSCTLNMQVSHYLLSELKKKKKTEENDENQLPEPGNSTGIFPDKNVVLNIIKCLDLRLRCKSKHE